MFVVWMDTWVPNHSNQMQAGSEGLDMFNSIQKSFVDKKTTVGDTHIDNGQILKDNSACSNI